MNRRLAVVLTIVFIGSGMLACSKNVAEGPPVGAGGATGAGGSGPERLAVVTDRFDNARSAATLRETILTTSNVAPGGFGLLFSRAITGDAYAQPLYVAGVDFGGGVQHNVVYVATSHNWIYAFDADGPIDAPSSPSAAADPLWSRMLGAPLLLGAGGDYDPGCTDMRNEVGVTSTPVISLADNKIFVVAKVPGDQHLHALDLATGADADGSPVSIGNVAMTAFDPAIHLNRAALLLLGGVIYVGYGSHCDKGAYHGWIFGYDAKTLQLVRTYNDTPTGTWGAIWQSGVGLSSDGTDIFATVGNGTAPALNDGVNMGNNVVRWTPTGATLTVAAHYQAPVHGDNDLQSGALLLGDSGRLLGGGKDGNVLLFRSSDMSLVQQIAVHNEINGFAFWNGSQGPLAYVWPTLQPLHAYQVATGGLTEVATSAEKQPVHPSAMFVISSNGAMPGTGVLWASMPIAGDAWHATATGALYAYDASDVSKPSLWNSTLDPADAVGTFAKYSPPIVANGKVYLNTFSGRLQVYGLKP